MENFCVLESIGKIRNIAIVSSNQNDILEKNKYLLIKERKNFRSSRKKTYKGKRKKSGEINLHCKHSWFSEFDFISYSKSTDGLLCAACVLFPMATHRGSRSNALITPPYHNCKVIKEDILKNYCTLQYHKESMEILRGFVKNHKNSEKFIDPSINTKTLETVKKIKNIFLR